MSEYPELLQELEKLLEDYAVDGYSLEQLIQENPNPTYSGLGQPSNQWKRRRFVKNWLDEQGIHYETCDWSDCIIIDGDESVTNHNGYEVAQAAYEGHGFTCDGCREVYHNSDRHSYHEDDLCAPCYDDAVESDTEDNGGLRDCSASPMDILKGFLSAPGEKLPKKPLWLGVELEVVAKSHYLHDGLEPAKDTMSDHAIFKEDGSLPHYGFEIVTVPGTLAWHRLAWQDFFKHAAGDLLSYHAPGRCCGMHVHISRDALTPLQAGKMMVFVADPANAEFLKTIAGRWGNSYAQIREKSLKDGRFSRGVYHDHFDALGFSNRTRETMEFRIFRGTVNEQGFFKNLEFTVALVEFCKDTSTANLLHGDFLTWFVRPENRTRFPALDAFFHRKNLIKVKKPKPVLEAA